GDYNVDGARIDGGGRERRGALRVREEIDGAHALGLPREEVQDQRREIARRQRLERGEPLGSAELAGDPAQDRRQLVRHGRTLPLLCSPAMGTESPPISRFPVPALADLPDDIRARILAVQEKSGFVPNVFLVLAHGPDEFRAFFAYHDALMAKEGGGLSKAEREMIVVATSGANNCQYCVIAHGAILRIYEKNPLIADQIAVNYRKADLTPRRRAMLDFAEKVALRSHEIDDADYAALRAHGFSDEDAWDTAALAVFAPPQSGTAMAAGSHPNAEFYLRGGVLQNPPI